MAGRDFFDEDLVKHRDEIKRIKMGPADKPAKNATPDPVEGVGVSPVGDFNLTRMMRRKEKIAENSVHATEELERLRNRQQDLERQKKDLENMRSRIAEFEAGRREMLEMLAQSVVSLEKRGIQTSTLADLLELTRVRFNELREELQSLDETSWSEDVFREELGKALTTVENARMEFNKSSARVKSIGSEQEPVSASEYAPAVFSGAIMPPLEEKSFGDWIRIGFAVSLPLLVLLSIAIVLQVIYFVKSGYFGW